MDRGSVSKEILRHTYDMMVTYLLYILVFVFQTEIQYIHGISIRYDHIVDILTYIWTSLEILTYARDLPSMCKSSAFQRITYPS